MTKTIAAETAPQNIPLEDASGPSSPTGLSLEPKMTPAGLQKTASLMRRRAAMLVLCLSTLGVIAYSASVLLSVGGWTIIDIGILVTILLSAPWTVLGFWNAVVGLWLLRFVRDPLAKVSPFLNDEIDETAPISGRVAVFMTLRNEDPDRAFQRLVAMRRSLDDTGVGDRFDVFVLSDTDQEAVAKREAALFEANRTALDGRGRATYRRRTENDGFKAGNVRDFLNRWGDGYVFMIPLDADSVMSGAMMTRMVRLAERHPKIGILQSLGIGAPAESPFARIFQFGMRHGMRSFTMGSAWWQGDCGPFWGHNAVVRVAPFKESCEMPVLPGRPPLGGHILSHDQVEAALMRRAGYEVRVMPVEGESWEDNPVTLLDFMKREQRWCNGNMQYWPLLGMRGLRPVSRFQLLQAILMYLAPPAWMLMTLLAGLKVLESDVGHYNASLAIGLFFAMFFMSLAPKLAGVIDVALQPGGMRRYGGPRRFAASAAVETVFSMLMAPAMALRLTIFLVGLLFGRRIAWNGQVRDAYGLAWTTALRGLWPQVAFGAFLAILIGWNQPAVLAWAAPVLAGLLLAPAFAVATASPAVGRALWSVGLAQIPEETRPSPMLERVDRVAVAEASRPVDAPPAAAIAAE